MAATLKMVTAQIPESVFWELETYAKELDRSKSWLVRQAIVDMLKNRKKTQQQNNESEWDELFALFREAQESGETLNCHHAKMCGNPTPFWKPTGAKWLMTQKMNRINAPCIC
ncbi:MAG: hypothetical protein IKI11_02425 [Neisseriaceae bacterium]|nr:hypothetical protein [Neisseriaceae bacterium]